MRYLLCTGLALGVMCTWSFAETIQLRPDADASLRQSSPDSNFGASVNLMVGVNSVPHNHGVFRFNLSAIPTNAIVTSASLQFIVVQNTLFPADYDLNRVLIGWAETNVTWNHRTASDFWSAAGAESGVDYESAPSATAGLDVTGTTNVFASAELADDVRAWLSDPASNFGWILIATEELSGSMKQVGSRENPGHEPVLTVNYIVPNPVVRPLLTVMPAVNGMFRIKFSTQTGHSYTVEFTDNPAETNWSTLIHIGPPLSPGYFVIGEPFTPTNRFYRVRVD